MFEAAMFGRERELEQLDELLDRAARSTAVWVVEGAPGIGKTALWDQAVARARGRDFEVLVAAPAEPDRALAFSALADLFDRLAADTLEVLPEPQRLALASALNTDAQSLGSVGAHSLGRAVLSVLRRLATTSSVFVAVDDEHWLDAASSRALAFALSRLQDERIAVFITRRPDAAAPLSAAIKPSLGGRVAEYELEPLDVESVRQMFADRLTRPPSRALTQRIHAASGGNPLYALAIAAELGGVEPDSSAPLPVPPALAELFELRLARLDPVALDAMALIAAASKPTLALLDAVLPGFTLADLESAERAGLVEITGQQVRFSHPLLASLHYGLTPAPRRRALHRALADAVGDAEQRARHLALGAEAPDLAIAEAVRDAALAARGRGAPIEAADLLLQAIRLAPQDERELRYECAVISAELHFETGEVARARRELDDLLAELPPGRWRARALRQLALIRNDDLAAAQALVDEALANAGGELSLRARLKVERALVSHNRGDFTALVAYAQEAVDDAKQAGDQGLLALALGERALAAFFTGSPVSYAELEAAARFEHSAEATTFQLPTSVLGQLGLWSDDFEMARPWLERAAAAALQRGEEYDRGAMLVLLGFLEWGAGDLAAARRYRRAAELAWGEFGQEPGWWHAWLDSWMAAAAGELSVAASVAKPALEQCRCEMGPSAPILVPLHTVLAAVELWSGRPTDAHERLLAARGQALRNGFRVFAAMTVSLWSCDIEALIEMEQLWEARSVLAEMREHAQRSPNPHARAITERCEGLVLAACGDPVGADAAFQRALEEHRQRMVPLEHARTRFERGGALRRSGACETARAELEAALGALHELGANYWIERAEVELRQLGVDTQGGELEPAGAVSNGSSQEDLAARLSARERELIGLIAEGLTDAQIAQRLYISVKTVHSHLDRIRDKTGARRRAQLTRLALSLPDEPEP